MVKGKRSWDRLGFPLVGSVVLTWRPAILHAFLVCKMVWDRFSWRAGWSLPLMWLCRVDTILYNASIKHMDTLLCCQDIVVYIAQTQNISRYPDSQIARYPYPYRSKSINIHPNPWKLMKINEIQWKSMKINEIHWKSMKINENQSKSIQIHIWSWIWYCIFAHSS